MANNRLWLVNKRTGERAQVAKYYPGTGWYLQMDQTRVASLLDGEPQEPSQWGNEPLVIEYDTP